jgi:lipopolysaccharide export system protein LptC
MSSGAQAMSLVRSRVLALRVLGPSSVLLLLAGISAWLLHDVDPSGLDSAPTSRHAADFFVENFTATTMDENGNPRRRVQAEHMAHFPDTNTHELKQPYLQVFNAASLPWHVTSQRGWLSAKGDVMLLLGEVHIWRNAPDGTRKMDIKTSDLRVLPESEYGETDKPVVITTPHSQSHSVGMRAFLDQGRLEMLSQVRTIYDRHAFEK